MHESSLAKQLLDAVLQRANGADALRVRAVHGFIAETEALSTRSLAFHFAAHARGTPAQGAELAMRLIHVEALCRACDTRYAPEHHILLCPTCGSTEGELLGKTGVGIDFLEVE